MMRIFIFMLIALMVVSCNPCKRLTKRCGLPAASDSTQITTSETTSIHSTWTEPDSSWYYFAIECDSEYRAILYDYSELTAGLQSKVRVKEVVRYLPDKKAVSRLEINITALVDSIEVQNKTIEKLRNEKRIVKEPYPVEIIKYKTRSFFIYGTIACGVLVIILGLIGWFKFKGRLLKFIGKI